MRSLLDAPVPESAALTHPLLRDASGSRPSERYEGPIGDSLSERWPLDDPIEPVSEHNFADDLRSLRHAVVAHPSLEGLTGSVATTWSSWSTRPSPTRPASPLTQIAAVRPGVVGRP